MGESQPQHQRPIPPDLRHPTYEDRVRTVRNVRQPGVDVLRDMEGGKPTTTSSTRLGAQRPRGLLDVELSPPSPGPRFERRDLTPMRCLKALASSDSQSPAEIRVAGGRDEPRLVQPLALLAANSIFVDATSPHRAGHMERTGCRGDGLRGRERSRTCPELEPRESARSGRAEDAAKVLRHIQSTISCRFTRRPCRPTPRPPRPRMRRGRRRRRGRSGRG